MNIDYAKQYLHIHQYSDIADAIDGGIHLVCARLKRLAIESMASTRLLNIANSFAFVFRIQVQLYSVVDLIP